MEDRLLEPEPESPSEQQPFPGQPESLQDSLQYQLREQEALIARLDTLQKSASIVASTLNPVETAEKILEQLARVVPFDSASVQVISEDMLEIIAGRGFPEGVPIIGRRFPLSNDELSLPILKGEALYVIHDDVQEFAEAFRIPPHNLIRSWMAIPLRSKGALIGVITLDGQRVGQFTQRDAELALSFADQVAIALDNARLFERLQQELEERRKAEAALELIQEQYRTYVAVSGDAILHIEFSPPIPTTLPQNEQMNLILQRGRVVECNAIAAQLYEYESAEALMGLHLTETLIGQVPEEVSILQKFISSNYRLLDLEATGDVNDRLVYLRASLIGILEAESLVHVWVNIRDETQRRLAEQKAAQAARHLAMLNEIDRVVSEETDLDTVLELIRQQLEKVVAFDFYSVRMFDEIAETVSYLAVYEDGHYWPQPEASLNPGTPAYQVFKTGRSLLKLLSAEEAEEDRRNPHLRIGNLAKITTSLIFVPLKKKGRTIGAISVQSYQPNAYTLADLKLVEDVAIQVAIAIENARLFASLQEELEERRNAEDQVRQLNEELERRVQERTAQLELANRELEAFSYSVSHDLRAPLRAINGFSLALAEDYSGRLDETAQDYLAKIRRATRSMGQLIDNLLNLARITRSEMNIREIDLSRLVAEILANLQASEPDRRAEFTIQPGLKTRGDEQLLRIMLTNLVANAWKFTSKKPLARIEFGCTAAEGRPVYFIRDNGAGFDMAYADKLFESFQRLHGLHEFEGTGIGLAIVKRIVLRHGGQIWAEGAVEAGAAFNFTLGNQL